MKLITLLAVLLFIFPILTKADSFTVKRVIDGQTLEMTNGEKVRLIGLQPIKEKEAMEYLQEMRLQMWHNLRIGYDVQKKDEKGRTLAYVYLCDVSVAALSPDYSIPKYATSFEGHTCFMLNAMMINAGIARSIIQHHAKYAKLFEDLYFEARIYERGLWADYDEKKEQYSAMEDKAMRDEKTCQSLGGDWGMYPISPEPRCVLPTKDAGEECSEAEDCEGLCIAELTAEDEEKLKPVKTTFEIFEKMLTQSKADSTTEGEFEVTEEEKVNIWERMLSSSKENERNQMKEKSMDNLPGIPKKGKCAAQKPYFGCYYTVDYGRVRGMICVE